MACLLFYAKLDATGIAIIILCQHGSTLWIVKEVFGNNQRVN